MQRLQENQDVLRLGGADFWGCTLCCQRSGHGLKVFGAGWCGLARPAPHRAESEPSSAGLPPPASLGMKHPTHSCWAVPLSHFYHLPSPHAFVKSRFLFSGFLPAFCEGSCLPAPTPCQALLLCWCRSGFCLPIPGSAACQWSDSLPPSKGFCSSHLSGTDFSDTPFSAFLRRTFGSTLRPNIKW